MTPDTAEQALSREELALLSNFQDKAGAPAMSLESIDGFFCALICGPQAIAPGEYLPEIWGDELAFESQEQVRTLLDLLIRHWNHIARTLEATPPEAAMSYAPWLRADEQGFMRGSDWAAGFMRGVRLRRGTWRELMLDPKHAGWLTPVLALTHENDPDPSLRSPLLARDKRPQLLALMAGSLPKIYQYFAAARQKNDVTPAAPESFRHETPRPGRNDPCPCGSGKKYKQCCLH